MYRITVIDKRIHQILIIGHQIHPIILDLIQQITLDRIQLRMAEVEILMVAETRIRINLLGTMWFANIAISQRKSKDILIFRVNETRHLIDKFICCLIVFRLTVRKEGPNKGRPFYVCPKDPQCPGNFFKWGDEASNNNSFAGPSGNSGTRNAPQNDNNAGQRGQGRVIQVKQLLNMWSKSKYVFHAFAGTRAKRKCGICKEEGHTRAKCPRNGG